jgi:hypothetical protein
MLVENGKITRVVQLIKGRVALLDATDAAIPGTTYGASLHGEHQLLVKFGLAQAQQHRPPTTSISMTGSNTSRCACRPVTG